MSFRNPINISASTPYDFNGRNLTPYGGLLPVITVLEKLNFRALVEQTLTSKRLPRAMDQAAQYQLFATSQYTYRVFVTDMSDPIYFVAWFYRQRGGAESLTKEANNDAGLAAHFLRPF
jgi:hypothetical protein